MLFASGASISFPSNVHEKHPLKLKGGKIHQVVWNEPINYTPNKTSRKPTNYSYYHLQTLRIQTYSTWFIGFNPVAWRFSHVLKFLRWRLVASKEGGYTLPPLKTNMSPENQRGYSSYSMLVYQKSNMETKNGHISSRSHLLQKDDFGYPGVSFRGCKRKHRVFLRGQNFIKKRSRLRY